MNFTAPTAKSFYNRQPNLSIKVPPSPPFAHPRMPCSPITNDPPPPVPQQPTVMNRLRSLTVNGFRGVSKPPKTPTTSAPSGRPRSGSATSRNDTPSKSKSKPSSSKPRYDLPSTFAAEVALLQLLDGGSTSHNIRRVHRIHAKHAAKAGVPYHGVEASNPSANAGHLWRDAEEEAEYTGLVRGGCVLDKKAAKSTSSSKKDTSSSARPLLRTDHDDDESDSDAEPWQPHRRSSPPSPSGAKANAAPTARDEFMADSFAPTQSNRGHSRTRSVFNRAGRSTKP